MYSKILYGVEKSKRVSVNYRLDPETVTKIEAVAAYYNITSTAAIEVAITNELERIDTVKAKRPGQLSVMKFSTDCQPLAPTG